MLTFAMIFGNVLIIGFYLLFLWNLFSAKSLTWIGRTVYVILAVAGGAIGFIFFNFVFLMCSEQPYRSYWEVLSYWSFSLVPALLPFGIIFFIKWIHMALK